MSSVYGNVTEELPSNAPASLGKEVTITTYVDANLYHNWTTGRAVTGTLDFLNGTPIDWFSKRQNTVETATYGSEFVAARIATDRIIDMRMTLRYLGVPIKGKSYMFGDNQSVVTSSTIPHSKLKNGTLLSCTIGCNRPLRQRFLTSFILTGRLILPMFSASIVDTLTRGRISSGCYFGKVLHLWKVK